MARKQPPKEVKLRIKWQYKDSGMHLDGYCFFAQKMRQLLLNESKQKRLKSLE
jgi:hypothetical protein